HQVLSFTLKSLAKLVNTLHFPEDVMRLCAFLLGSMLAATPASLAGDWPCFRGPERDGNSPVTKGRLARGKGQNVPVRTDLSWAGGPGGVTAHLGVCGFADHSWGSGLLELWAGDSEPCGGAG